MGHCSALLHLSEYSSRLQLVSGSHGNFNLPYLIQADGGQSQAFGYVVRSFVIYVQKRPFYAVKNIADYTRPQFYRKRLPCGIYSFSRLQSGSLLINLYGCISAIYGYDLPYKLFLSCQNHFPHLEAFHVLCLDHGSVD
ncbi:hypothetical protein SDC9_115476 [bioreactor metagenome]|uniref:Uncharacterized protein n=1 Tax=bioreactor metagenome TaxID=1076179 RepID=A0A645BZL0_9ZZZZ